MKNKSQSDVFLLCSHLTSNWTYNQIFFLNAFLAFLAGSAKIMWKIDVNPFWRLPLAPHYLFILHSAAIYAACDETFLGAE